MVKRGIGAVVLAIIAALLLGYLLKDKSRERQEVVEMKLPGAPEITIPSLSDTTSKVTDSAATLVNEATDSVKNAGNAVVASASGALTTLSNGTSNTLEAVTDSATSTVSAVTQKIENTVVKTGTSSQSFSNPGFSFRPPNKNEEQQINTSTAVNNTDTTAVSQSNNNVVASTPKVVIKEEKTFKPTIENEPKKAVKKPAPAKKVVAKKAARKPTKKPAATSTSGGKYSIQLLATSSQSRANKLAKTMNGEGYVSYITQTTSNNKVLYRVRVGGHKDRNSALSAQQTMKRRYQKNFFVQNSLVVSQ